MGKEKIEIWETFAREDAEFYIHTTQRERGSTAFYDSGQVDVEGILRESRPYLASHRHALEIGCGVGRLTLPIADVFERVVGIDVAPTMLRKLRANCEAHGVENVETRLPDEVWAQPGSIDLAFSRVVFQHIESAAVIQSYLSSVARALRSDGIAHLHFDTRPKSLGYRLRNRVPDPLLPKDRRRGIRRTRRSSADVRRMMNTAGLAIVEELRVDSAEHVLLARSIVDH